jgi:hypothetical protein
MLGGGEISYRTLFELLLLNGSRESAVLKGFFDLHRRCVDLAEIAD